MLIWKSLGIVTPSLMSWRLFDLPTSQQTFKVTFFGLTPNRWSYIRIRNRFDGDEVSQSIRVYPKQEETIIELPVPPELINYGAGQRWLEIAKFKVNYRSVSDADYQVQIEELV